MSCLIHVKSRYFLTKVFEDNGEQDTKDENEIWFDISHINTIYTKTDHLGRMEDF
jgi:hypothetical protein